jgi:hypothetical protein
VFDVTLPDNFQYYYQSVDIDHILLWDQEKNVWITDKIQMSSHFIQILCGTFVKHYIWGMIFFCFLTNFSIFYLKLFSKSYWTQSEQVKNDNFERGVDGFNYFSLILDILFSNQDRPWIWKNYFLWCKMH